MTRDLKKLVFVSTALLIIFSRASFGLTDTGVINVNATVPAMHDLIIGSDAEVIDDLGKNIVLEKKVGSITFYTNVPNFTITFSSQNNGQLHKTGVLSPLDTQAIDYEVVLFLDPNTESKLTDAGLTPQQTIDLKQLDDKANKKLTYNGASGVVSGAAYDVKVSTTEEKMLESGSYDDAITITISEA